MATGDVLKMSLLQANFMVFSFFKKSAQKMPERPSAKPKGESGETAVAPATPAQTGSPSAEAPQEAPQSEWDLDFSVASTQPNGGYGIEIHEESDPFAEIAEHAAILYANGQDAAARSTLESSIQGNSEPGALKLWAMLFDLLRIQNDRQAFDAQGLEFARVCELSPPSWDTHPEKKIQKGLCEAGSMVLQGVLSGDDGVFNTLMGTLEKGEKCALELGRLAGLDAEAGAMLCRLLHQARRRNLEWQLAGVQGLVARLANRTVAGQAQDEPLWLLLMELYQYLGWEEQFEEKAVDYAVTFEVSPPSWEPCRTPPVPKEELSLVDIEEATDEPSEDVLEATQLEGEILQGNLKEFSRHLIPGQESRLDFSRVTRVDFVSAGAMTNLLKSSGCGPVIFFHPNRLVAELMRVMGIDQLVRIELSKH